MNPNLVKNYVASAAIRRNRIVLLAAAGALSEANAAASVPLGISQELDVAANERVDITHTGIESVTLGAAVTTGQMVASDTQGRAVPAVAGNYAIGQALEGGAVGERIRVLIQVLKL